MSRNSASEGGAACTRTASALRQISELDELRPVQWALPGVWIRDQWRCLPTMQGKGIPGWMRKCHAHLTLSSECAISILSLI